MIVNTDYFAHTFRQIMNEPDNTDPNLITGKETKDCWVDRGATHHVINSPTDKPKSLSKYYRDYPRLRETIS